MFCNKCGNELPENSGFCPKCGATQVNEETDVMPTVAAPVSVGISVSAQAVEAKKKGKNKFVVPAVIFGVIIIIIIAIVGNSGDSSSSYGNGSTGDKYVQMVKGGTLNAYPQTTVGKAFNSFMANAKWESIVADDGNRYVNVRGTIQYMEKDVGAAVQFRIYDDDTFEYYAFEMNGIPQNDLMFWSLLEAVYNE